MVSSKKKFLTRFLRGTVVAIIIYITVSILTTKIIYDYVFKRYDGENIHGHTVKTGDMVAKRKEYSYSCDEYTLKGDLYSSENSEYGLIVLAPGFRAESLEYEGVIYGFLKEGFDVFSFDPTGHGDSQGESSVGFPQIVRDIDSTLEFINNNGNFDYDDIFLLGHSRGGYGVCCSMNSHGNIKAVASVNGVDTAMDAIMAYSTRYVGAIAYGNYPFLSMYQSFIFGSELAKMSSVEEINKSDIPVLIIQSDEDETISKEKFSVYSHREEITSDSAEIVLYGKSGFNGHKSILYNEKGLPNMDIIKKISEFYKSVS